MSSLPSNWTEAAVEEINCHESRNVTPSEFPEEIFELYSVPAFPADQPEHALGKDIGSSKLLVEPNDVLLCKINPRINRVWLVGEKRNFRQIASSEWIVVRSRVMFPQYLRYAFSRKKFRDLLCSEVAGVGGSLTRAQPKKVARYTVLVAPLNEQIRIANKLDSILAKVDAAQARLGKIPALLKRFRQAVLSAATSGELTGEWRSNQAPAWATVCLKEVARGFNYGSSAKSQSEGKVPVLRMGNLQGGRLDWDDLVYTSDEDEIEKYLLEPGDVLFNRTNSPELVGKTSIYRGERKCIFAGYLIRIKGSNRLDSEFLNIQLNSPGARDYCWQVKTDGVSQSNINAKKIQAYEFKLPPMEEQKEIVRRVESLFALADAVEKQYLDARKRTDRLTQSLLAKAFRGELVPQDPNDEPAEELLKRIKTEREHSPASGRNRKTATRKQSSTKKIKAKIMKLADAPASYLFDLLTDLGGEAHAEVLWKKSELGIDDFYAKLKQEVRAKRIVDNGSRDPGQRKLAINKG